jgi:hypothetical protein
MGIAAKKLFTGSLFGFPTTGNLKAQSNHAPIERDCGITLVADC